MHYSMMNLLHLFDSENLICSLFLAMCIVLSNPKIHISPALSILIIHLNYPPLFFHHSIGQKSLREGKTNGNYEIL